MRARLPGPVPECGERLAPATGTATTESTRGSRRSWRSRSTRRRRERVDSPLGPTSRGGALARPRARSRTYRPRGRGPRTSRSTDRHGSAEAQGGSRAADGAAEPPRPHACRDSRSVRIATSRSCPTASARTCGWYNGRLARASSRPAAARRARSPRTVREPPLTIPARAPMDGDSTGRRTLRRPDRGRRDGRRPRRAEVVPGAIAYAVAHPDDTVILVGDDDAISALALTRPRPTSGSSTRARSSAWTSTRRWPCARRSDASILVATRARPQGEADAVVTAGHTGAGMAAGVLRLGRCRASTGRRSRSRSRSPAAGRSCCSTSAPTPTRRPRTSRSTPAWARSSRSASWASPAAGRAPVDRRGEGQGRRRVQRATEPPRRDRPELRRQRRGQGPHQAPGRRRRLRRRLRQRRDQVLRGPVGFIFDLFRGEFRALARGRLAYSAAPGHRPDPRGVRLRGRRRLAAARRQRRRDHHPRPRQAADDRARVRVGATTARERVPERIAEALAADARRGPAGLKGWPPRRTGRPMSPTGVAAA